MPLLLWILLPLLPAVLAPKNPSSSSELVALATEAIKINEAETAANNSLNMALCSLCRRRRHRGDSEDDNWTLLKHAVCYEQGQDITDGRGVWSEKMPITQGLKLNQLPSGIGGSLKFLKQLAFCVKHFKHPYQRALLQQVADRYNFFCSLADADKSV